MENARAFRYRFGLFEADPAAGELRRSGRLVKIQDQPFRLLILFLEHPGEVVTREQLRERVWGETFVDFEEGLNTAIRKVRDALDDSASKPRYLETVPRRGYRFIAPVEKEGGEFQHPEPPISPKAVRDAPPVRRWLWAVGGVAVLGIAGMWVWRVAGKPSETGRVPVLRQVTVDPGLTVEPTVWAAGNMVAYASDRAGNNLDIWVQNLATNETRRLTADPADEREPSFSPDGSRIAFRSERDGGGIYVVPALGGEEQKITNGGRGPVYSPDGKWIAYYEGVPGFEAPYVYDMPALYIAPASGGVPRRLVPGFVAVSQPVWSPDGKHLLIVGGPSPEELDWWLAPIEGGSPVRLPVIELIQKGRGLRRAPNAWSGDWIYFTADLGDSRNIWKVPIDGRRLQFTGEAVRVTSGSGIEESLRPAGDRLIFSNLSENADVWVLPIEPNSAKVTGKLQRITEEVAPNDTASVDSAGRYTAFRTYRGGANNIVLRDLSTGQERILATTQMFMAQPRISPDGKQVAYNALVAGKEVIQIVPAAGGPPRHVAEGLRLRGFASDGRRLIVGNEYDLGLLDLDTGKIRLLLRPPVPNANFGSPGTAPGDKWIVFYTYPGDGKTKIWVAPVRDTIVPKTDWIPITDGDHWDVVTRFSPDGNTIYFFSRRDGFFCQWAIRIDAVSKRPIGKPFPVYHHHDRRRSPGYVRPGRIDSAIARDKIVFTMAERTGNIWMLDGSK